MVAGTGRISIPCAPTVWISKVSVLYCLKVKKARQSLEKYFFTIHYYFLLPQKLLGRI